MNRRRIAITLGDPCGIGPELLLRCLPHLHAAAAVTVVGSRAGLDLLQPVPGSPVAWRWQPADLPPGCPGQAAELEVREVAGPQGQAPATCLWVDPTPELQAGDLRLGEASAASGRAAVEAVRIGAQLTMAQVTEALVTLPLSKAAAHLAGYDIPGHTEFLRDLSGARQTRMAFVSPQLNVVLHTVHQSLRSVVEGLNAAEVAATLGFTAAHMAPLLGQPHLRVALCALNPHAGEAGAFGDEEAMLRDALDRAQAAHPATRFSGPWPADSLFHRAVSREFDVVVALYHDQGLIPIKVLEPTRAVNLTLGLPFIRTSPDHGTAFDRAGRWQADPRNFMEAARLALRLSGRDQ